MTRATFGLLERHAPSLGSWWAERLWCTVPTSDKARSAFAEPGTVVTLPLDAAVREVTGVTGVAGVTDGAGGDGVGDDSAGGDSAPTFVAESWGESGPIIYLIHGWGGYREQFGSLVGPLVAAGYRVVALDVPGHGDAGRSRFGAGRSLLPDFTGTLNAAVRAFGPAYALVGHSLGGGAVALAVLDGLSADRLVLIAPSPDPVAYSRAFAAALGFGDRIREGLLRRVERRAGRPMADFDAVSRARAATEARAASGRDGSSHGSDAGAGEGAEGGLPPLLVVHDHEDRKVPYSMGKAIATAWQGAELCGTRGLGHQRILRDPGVISTVTQFLGVRATAGRTDLVSKANAA